MLSGFGGNRGSGPHSSSDHVQAGPSGAEGETTLIPPSTSGSEVVHSIKSGPSTRATTVTFKNATTVTIQAFWIDYDGKEVAYEKIKPGQTYRQRTFVLHPWAFRECASNEPLVVGKKLVALPEDAEESEMVIVRPGSIRWSPESHNRFPEAFRESVKALLLSYQWCHVKSEYPENPWTQDRLGLHMSELPLDLIHTLVEMAAPDVLDIDY
ncbi:unnamed protein product [Closterium sp. Yama58-4]|nr:unnamed protein product [Closterium sp. Yama58-4]